MLGHTWIAAGNNRGDIKAFSCKITPAHSRIGILQCTTRTDKEYGRPKGFGSRFHAAGSFGNSKFGKSDTKSIKVM